MTEAQETELNELRREEILLRETITKMESEWEDTQYEIRNIEKWKKGRWVPALISFILLCVSMGIMLVYAYIQDQSMGQRIGTKSAAVEFSVSTTVMTFFILVLLVQALVTIYLLLKMMLELSSGRTSRNLAIRFNVRNYYNRIEGKLERENDQKKELIELRARKSRVSKRIQELEVEETPWYEQQGSATLKYF